MIGRLDLFGRLMLILLGALVLLGTAGVTLFYVREAKRPNLVFARFPRLEQAAGIIDLAASMSPDERKALVRAASGVDLATSVLPKPPTFDGLRVAPHLTTRLLSRIHSRVPAIAYVSPLFRSRDPKNGVEGFLARAVARLPDGQFVVIDTIATGDKDAPRLFGRPASQWMGAAATLVVLLALWGTARETRPLRRLVKQMGAFDGTSVTITDPPPGAADIRRTSEAAAAMQERVQMLLGERSLMVGAISHDLRTFLTRMQLRVANLPDTDVRALLERDLVSMDAMLSDALAFARGTSAGTERTAVDLADLAATEAAERDARGQICQIECVLMDAVCLGDQHALRRVVANLIDNAVKYGRGRVRVSTGTAENRAWLTVEDDGPGVSPDQRTEMLQPYRRGETALRTGLAGSGLGLAIVQQIVQSHGGKITIETSTLGGAQVIVEVLIA